MDLDLKDNIVLVTGSNRGIGESICKAFLNEGAYVIAIYRGDEGKIAPLIDWCKANDHGNRISGLVIDLQNKTDVDSKIKQILKDHKRIDVLVNCAGATIEKPFALTEEQEWEKIMSSNLTTVVNLTASVLKPMTLQRKGSIINISSILGFRLGRGATAYAASKAAVDRLTQSLAMEVGKKGVRVNCVSPGPIQTKMSSTLHEYLGSTLASYAPIQRFGTPEEVASAVLFLASERTASYITGQKIVVDGGISI
jgi:3-oxoacyl-[acyl-carrier protein] reductase